MTCLHLIISGFVQGVFFRDSMKRKAEQLGINGWVRNTSTGKVEAVVEGEESKVKELLEWCTKGPRSAEVEDVKVKEENEQQLDGFEVRN
jgi:acylphosphatase